jgi:transposase
VQIDLAALPDDPAVLQRMLQEVVPELQAENEELWQLIQRLLRHRYGPRSEKLDLDQLQLVLEDAEQSAAESDAARDAAEPPERRRRREVANRNRGALPAHLPRYEVVIDIENKECPCCGGALHVIGDDRTEMLDLIPAQLRVKVMCRPRYGCRTVRAPAPERPIDGGMATEALVAHVLVSKFCDSLPLYRGTLQVDGYAGFSLLVEARQDASLRLAFCWAHARRPFYEFYTSTQSPLAAEVLVLPTS